MEQGKPSSRRERNREAVTKYRNKVKHENDEIHKLYVSNEHKIAHLEKWLTPYLLNWPGRGDNEELFLVQIRATQKQCDGRDPSNNDRYTNI